MIVPVRVPAAQNAAEALERIAAGDAELRAWVQVDREAPRRPVARGPLSGVPFGVKDVIDVAGLSTRNGLELETPAAALDAWCVAALRAAGAVPVGKTVTTPLAFKDPALTRNPHDAARTPGGSSAGSAAAVAAGHVPFALGTQTIGSILRPASFCGVVGFKPTFGSIPMQGVGRLAPSLDHVGVLARDVETAARFATVFLSGIDSHSDRPPRIAFAPQANAERFESEVRGALAALADRLRAGGCTVDVIDLPSAVDASVDALDTILAAEAFASLGPLRALKLPPQIDALIARGAGISYEDYREALASRNRTRGEIAVLVGRFDALMLGAANTAPSRESTGDPLPLAPWSYWGFPALSLPVATSTEGLPIGVQLVGGPGSDAALLRAARWIERTLAGSSNQIPGEPDKGDNRERTT